MKITYIHCILLSILLLIPLAIALDFDNVKEVKPIVGKEYPNITIKNGFGLGSEIATYSLDANTEFCYTDCSAEGVVTLKEAGTIFDSIRFVKLNGGSRSIPTNVFLKTEEPGFITVEDFTEVCAPPVNKNSSLEEVCVKTKIGVHLEPTINEVLTPYTGSILPIGSYRWKIKGTKLPTETVDWIPTAKGVSLDEWAFWIGVNPSGYWKFNQKGAENATDSSPKNNTFFYKLGTQTAASYVLGKLGNATKIPGAGIKFTSQLADNATFFTNNFTIAFWWNASITAGADNVIYKDTGSTGWFFQAVAPNPLKFYGGATSFDVGPADMLTNKRWHRVVLVRQGVDTNQVKIYINGTNTANTTLADNISDVTTNLSIIALGDPDNFTIDDFQIFRNYAWTQLDVTFDWNNGTGIEADNVSVGSITVQLTSPANGISSALHSQIFNGTITSGENIVINSSLVLWNASGSILSTYNNLTLSLNGSTNISYSVTSLPEQAITWNIFACDTIGECGYSTINRTITITSTAFDAITYNSPVGEGSSQTFVLNGTYDPSFYTSISASLIYNNTAYSTSVTTSGNVFVANRTIIVPLGSNASNPFYFNVVVTNSTASKSSNTSTNYQLVNAINLDNCAVNNILILNYTMYDEDARTLLVPPAQNTTIELEVRLSNPADPSNVRIFNATYNNTNPARVCISGGILNSSTYSLNTIARYYSTDRVTEFHHLQNVALNNNTIPQRVNLYDLLTTSSQEFLITFKDANFIPVAGALIDITRKYVPIGSFISVEVPKTDSDGKTLGHFVLSDVIYTINVYKNGELLGTFENVRAFCANQAIGDCTITLTATSSTTRPSSFQNNLGVRYSTDYNPDTRDYTFTYSSVDGSVKNIVLNVTQFTADLNESICSSSVSSSSGTLTCNIPFTIGNGSAIAKVTSDGQLLLTEIFPLEGNATATLGYARFFFAFLLIISLAAMGIASGATMLIFFMIGLIVAGMLLFIAGGGVVGAASAIMWFFIAAAVLLWKLEGGRRE